MLEHETIEGKHIHEIIEKGEITSPIIKSIPLSKGSNDDEKEEEKAKNDKANEDDGAGPETVGIPA